MDRPKGHKDRRDQLGRDFKDPSKGGQGTLVAGETEGWNARVEVEPVRCAERWDVGKTSSEVQG